MGRRNGAAQWAVVVLMAACAHAPGRLTVKPQAVRLLSATPERETTLLTELRSDLSVDTDFERVPHVVATGESGVLQADDAQFTLAGDEAGTAPVFVDNFVLLEVMSMDGQVTGRAVVGYVDGVSAGRERVDSLGPQAFSVPAKEVSLAPILPERGPFRLRATALDIGGVGRVSDVFLLVAPKAAGAADELR